MTTLADISNTLASQNDHLEGQGKSLNSIDASLKKWISRETAGEGDTLEEKIRARRAKRNAGPAGNVQTKSGGISAAAAGGFGLSSIVDWVKNNPGAVLGAGTLMTLGKAGAGALKIGGIALLAEPVSNFLSGFATQMLENTNLFGFADLPEERKKDFAAQFANISQTAIYGMLFGKRGFAAALIGGAAAAALTKYFDQNDDGKLTSQIGDVEINWTSPEMVAALSIAASAIAPLLVRLVGRKFLLPAAAAALGSIGLKKLFGADDADTTKFKGYGDGQGMPDGERAALERERARIAAEAERTRISRAEKERFNRIDRALKADAALKAREAEARKAARQAERTRQFKLFRNMEASAGANYYADLRAAQLKAAKTAAAIELPNEMDTPRLAQLETGVRNIPELNSKYTFSDYGVRDQSGKFVAYDKVQADIDAVRAQTDDIRAKASGNWSKTAKAIDRFGRIAGPLGALVDVASVYSVLYNDALTETQKKKEISTILGGAAGSAGLGLVGASMGSFVVPPFGTLAGGLAGALLGGLGGDVLGRMMADWIFDENQKSISKDDLTNMGSLGMTQREILMRALEMAPVTKPLGSMGDPVNISEIQSYLNSVGSGAGSTPVFSTGNLNMTSDGLLNPFGPQGGLVVPLDMSATTNQTIVNQGDVYTKETESAEDKSSGGFWGWLGF